jgi:hydrogenase expression/formation protein HypC
MCLAIPGKVVSVEGTIAVIDFGGVRRETNVSLVEVKPGDYVIVHAGFAIQTVDEIDALETIKLWDELLASQEEV